jgi:DNA-binding ferritin-like protein (Dps family)
MRTDTEKLKKLNKNFYYLVKELQKYEFKHSALIAAYAYEEFLNEIENLLNNAN